MEISFFGNVGKDAVLRKVGEAEHQFSVCDVWVAENIQKRDGSKKTLWHKVTLWRNYAETMAQYLKTGRSVYVHGSAEAASYTKDNQIVPYIKVQADKIRLNDPKPEDEVPDDTEEEEELPFNM